MVVVLSEDSFVDPPADVAAIGALSREAARRVGTPFVAVDIASSRMFRRVSHNTRSQPLRIAIASSSELKRLTAAR